MSRRFVNKDITNYAPAKLKWHKRDAVLVYTDQLKYSNFVSDSSGKWSDPGHFLKSQGKFFLSFPYTLFYIFLTPKITKETLKSVLGRSIYH